MAKVGILTDTTASIPAELARELNIELVPYYVIRNQQSLRDMVDVEPEGFARYLESTETLPTTSCPSPGDYLEGFRRLAAKTLEIVAITMTSKGSGAFQSCKAAADMLGELMPQVHVEVVDTLQVAMAHGWAVIEAARAALSGEDQTSVVTRTRDVAHRGMMIQTADTLRYLYLGGRIGRTQHLVGSLLNFKPLIGMQDGIIVALGVARSRPKAYAKMAELACQSVGGKARIKIGFTHCAASEQLESLREQVRMRIECVEEVTSPLSPALAVHSGPGTVGLSLFAE